VLVQNFSKKQKIRLGEILEAQTYAESPYFGYVGKTKVVLGDNGELQEITG